MILVGVNRLRGIVTEGGGEIWESLSKEELTRRPATTKKCIKSSNYRSSTFSRSQLALVTVLFCCLSSPASCADPPEHYGGDESKGGLRSLPKASSGRETNYIVDLKKISESSLHGTTTDDQAEAGSAAEQQVLGSKNNMTGSCENAMVLGEDWKMPRESSVWKYTAFAGMTCDELEKSFGSSASPADMQGFCEFLSLGIAASIPSAVDSCCFCGGGGVEGAASGHGHGQGHYSSSSSGRSSGCENLDDWNEAKGEGGDYFGCESIDGLSEDDAKEFCDRFGSTSFSVTGATLAGSCCACGGGRLRSRRYRSAAGGAKPNGGPMLREHGLTNATTDEALAEEDVGEGLSQVFQEGRSVVDFTYRPGAGDSPGIPNLEYLGLGYNMFLGNPRGDTSSELDPGFRFRVLRLTQLQSDLTIDGEFTVPLGTEVKYISACKYDDSAVEISSESDMRESLSNEASFETASSSSTSGGYTTPLKSVQGNMEKNQAFSSSAKVRKERDEAERSASVSFEARAVCSEYEASFIPGYQHEQGREFKNALPLLPNTYEINIEDNKKKWIDLFDNFGTHYVKELKLGGKRIYSTSMNQHDYSSMIKEGIDVSSTMSFEMSAGMSASAGVNAGMVKGIGQMAQSFGGAKGAALGAAMNVAVGGKEDDETVFGADFNTASATSLAYFASSKSQAENAQKISQRKLSKQEYTIGGLPAQDWREWAASVKEKPMPIEYKLGSLMEFMTIEQQGAFIDAVVDIFQINLSDDGGSLDKSFHHGVFTGPGDPLSRHLLNPNSDNRVLMKNNVEGLGSSSNDGPSYGGSASYDGSCADARGRSYSSISFTKAAFTEILGITTLSGFKVETSDCIQHCKEVDAGLSQNQVGVSHQDSECHCYYDTTSPLQAPSASEVYIHYSVHTGTGAGPVAKGTPSAGVTCYTNENYSSTSPIFTFSDNWKGKMQTPFPIFATAIRGNIATDSFEESQIPYIGSDSQPNPWKDHMFYAMTSDINSNAILSVASFGELRNTFISSAQLPEFSFLAVDSLREPEHVRSGVVAYNGLISNTAARGNFTVVMNSDPNVRNFNVAFNNQVYSSAPTVIVFPNWFGVGDKYNPEIVEDVVLVLKEIDTAGFEVKLQSPVGRSYLGFNFMVIGPDAGNTIKHGVFYQCTNYINPNPSTAHGIVAHDTTCSNAGWLHTVSTTVMLGVEVVFETPFSDIPSVIVSPIVPNFAGNLNFSVRCIVESITKIGARVKCGWMKIDITPATYKPVPFSIVAVGN